MVSTGSEVIDDASAGVGLASAVLAVVVTITAPEGHSGELSWNGGTGACQITLSDEIIAGDTERLSVLLQAHGISIPAIDDKYSFDAKMQDMTLCLNSPGGSWDEGLLLARTIFRIGLGTRVNDGMSCLSACAIGFMGGRYRDYEGEGARRTLHVNGWLGFHSPYLVLPEGEYDLKTVEAAYSVALEQIGELVEFSMQRNSFSDAVIMKAGLIQEIVRHGPDQLYLIDTIEKAGRFDIDLTGHVIPPQITNQMVDDACRHFLAWIEDTELSKRADETTADDLHVEYGEVDPGNMSTVDFTEVARSRQGGYVDRWCDVYMNKERGSISFAGICVLDEFTGRMYGSDCSDRKIATPTDMWLFSFFPAGTKLAELPTGRNRPDAPAIDPPQKNISTAALNFPGPGESARDVSRPSGESQSLQITSYWLHNGSVMGLGKDDNRRTFVYLFPRKGLERSGVEWGTVLFEGSIPDGRRYQGSSRTFSARCGSLEYPVEGRVSSGDKRIVLQGKAPVLDARCRQIGRKTDRLIFEALGLAEETDISELAKRYGQYETLQYGTRAGQEVTVVRKSGLGSSRAEIIVRHTEENAHGFCVEYERRYDRECAKGNLIASGEEVALRANCGTMELSDFFGDRYRLEARLIDDAMYRHFAIRNLTTNEVLDGSRASNYSVIENWYIALCSQLR